MKETKEGLGGKKVKCVLSVLPSHIFISGDLVVKK